MTDPTPSDAPTQTTPASPAPAALFQGQTPRKTSAVRAGVVAGIALVLLVGAAVAMGASPSPSSSGGLPQATQGTGSDQNGGPKGFFGGPGPFDGGNPGRGLGDGKGRFGGAGFGQISVTAINGQDVSLATADGWTRTITITNATTITKGGAAATLTDLAVGDTVRFAQTRNADGSFTVTKIDIVQPQTAGTVTAVGADTITVTLRDGTSQTIKTTGSTTYHLERADGKRADVTVGSTIVATGERAADGSLTASSVWVRLPHVGGTVSATTGTTITLTRRDGTTVTVHIGSGTTIRVAGVENATASDIKKDMAVVVQGTQRADGSIDATAIGAGAFGKGFGRGGHDKVAPDASPAPDASSGTNA